MRKYDLMKALAAGQFADTTTEPPLGAVFLHSEEMKGCCSILDRLFQSTMNGSPDGRIHESIPLPDADLPMIF
ncbi:hypothetical protein D9X30_3218 (plasmid) [Cupriavidus sp. U2]|uniref:hypothetical protein n=1 Tax=Cupriavidus pauculus TaxID=82633 RepID=UPI001F2B7FB2|nr:hypothetical protein [Cupriavidus pauculus]KAI3591808.1 hypothetical protein D9X30_3218 [Cupriavidus sp. U2]